MASVASSVWAPPTASVSLSSGSGSSSPLLPRRDYAHIKVVSLGDGCVGKSCLIKRYCEKKFVSKYISTIGVDFGVRPYPLPLPPSTPPPPPFSLRLNFFDLSGSPFYRSIRLAFHPSTQLLLLCFDVNARPSFDRLSVWLREAEEGRGGQGEGGVVVVCGCMSGEEGCAEGGQGGGDEGLGLSSRRRRQVTEVEGRAWAEARGCLYHEVSAKTGRGVEALFDDALMRLAKRLQLP